MRQRPWVIKFVAVSLFIVPLTAAWFVFTTTRESGTPADVTIIVDLWVLGIGACVTALGIWRIRPWGFFTFFGFVIGVIGGDLYHIYQSPGTLRALDYLDAIVAAASVVFILQKHITAPYFNPKIRWWESAKRHKVELTSTVFIVSDKQKAQILDISETGCFVNMEQPKVNQGQVFKMSVEFEHFYFESNVRVIRHSVNPRGIGLMFIETNRGNRRELHRLIKFLVKADVKINPAIAA